MATNPGVIRFKERDATPVSPPAGYAIIYVKTDNVVYLQDSSGVEIALGSASSITQLTGDVVAAGPGVSGAVVAYVGGKSAAQIAQSVADTIAATASNANTTIVKRDGSGNFAANIITASLTGLASGNVDKAGDTMTGSLNMNGNIISNLATAVSSGDAINKAAYDAAIALISTAQAAADAAQADIDAHKADTSNPHSVTKAQVGLGNVDNTSDSDKPVSTAQAAAIAVVQSDVDAHEADTANPHNVTKAQVGLGNVDNTSDVNKPVSTAQAAADAVVKADIDTHKADTTNPHMVTQAQVGLGNVDNTSDVNKPVSTAQAAADAAVEAYSIQRAHHTGTQSVSTITGLAAVATSGDKADVGLGNVDNTSDANKPVSTAQAAAIAVVQSDVDVHEADTGNPHMVTQAQVGLGNVDNTSDVNKPVSTAQAAADAAVEAFSIQRANHTGTQTASTISDFTEAAQDAVGGSLTDTDSIAQTYDDAGNAIKADLKLSADPADANNIKMTTTIHSGANPGLHVEVPFDVPVQLGTSNFIGASSKVALSDHVHAHGSQTNGTLHAVVTSLVNGFMAFVDKVKLDAATALNTFSTIVMRDASGNFAATNITSNLTGNVTGNVSGSAASFTGNLAGDVTGPQGTTVVASVGGKSAAAVAQSVTDTVAATDAATASTIAKRDVNADMAVRDLTLRNAKYSGLAEFVQITTPTTPAATKADLYVSAASGFSALRFIDETGLVVAITRDTVFRVKNSSGSTITKGQAVYVSGADTGTNLATIALAKANSSSTMPLLGLAAESIANGSVGRIIITGFLSGIDTSGYTVGATVYVSETTAGGLTTTKPVTPNIWQRVGTVLSSNATTGVIELRHFATHGEESGTNTAWSSNVIALTDGTTIATDVSKGNTFTVTIAGNRTLSNPTGMNGLRQKCTWIVKQDATGGRTLSFGTNFNFGIDLSYLSLSKTANATDYIGAIYNPATSKWDVVAITRGY